MSPATLPAALHTEAVLPAFGLLAAHDPALPPLLAGPPLGVALSAPGGIRVHLGIAATGITIGPAILPGDLHFWFPHPAGLTRVFHQRRTLALPVSGWRHLRHAGPRLRPLGQRLHVLLEDRAAARADAGLAELQAWGNLLVGVAGAACWLRRHPAGAATRARLGEGLAVFEAAGWPGPAWLDLATLTWGGGPPPRPATVCTWFSSPEVALEEIDRRLDSLAALNTGAMRVTGRLPLAEALGLVMVEASRLLRPTSRS
jgi:hypothetical protein